MWIQMAIPPTLPDLLGGVCLDIMKIVVLVGVPPDFEVSVLNMGWIPIKIELCTDHRYCSSSSFDLYRLD
jgi:hypothetical protein